MGDHPPITPVRAATEGQLGDAYRLYATWVASFGSPLNSNDSKSSREWPRSR